MILSGGNFGGYVIEGTNAVLYENGEVVDTQVATIGDDITVNGWVYNDQGLFIGMSS